MELAEAVRIVREERWGGTRHQEARETVLAALEQAQPCTHMEGYVERLEAERDALQAERNTLRGAIEVWQREAQSGWESARIAEAERNALMEDVQSTGKLWHDAEARAERAEAALKQIAAWSWDSGSTPAPEVVSRIYCEARAALRDPAPAEGFFARGEDGQYHPDPPPACPHGNPPGTARDCACRTPGCTCSDFARDNVCPVCRAQADGQP